MPCDELRPALSRVASLEAEPGEALEVARHLPNCTACRIVLARERRLAEWLEHDLEDAIPVDEEFLQAVMSRLPSGRPVPRRRRRRGLGVATLAGGTMLVGAVLQAAAAAGGSAIDPGLPALAPTLGEGALAAAERLAGLAAAFGALGTGLSTELPRFGTSFGLLAALPALSAAWLALTALVAFAARRACAVRPRP